MSGGATTYKVVNHTDIESFFKELVYTGVVNGLPVEFDAIIHDDFVESMIANQMMDAAERNTRFTVSVEGVRVHAKSKSVNVVDGDGIHFRLVFANGEDLVFTIFRP